MHVFCIKIIILRKNSYNATVKKGTTHGKRLKNLTVGQKMLDKHLA